MNPAVCFDNFFFNFSSNYMTGQGESMKKYAFVPVALFICCLSFSFSADEKRVGEGVTIYPEKVTVPPKIDAVLDDEVWKKPPTVSGYFIANRPEYGKKLSQKTDVWLSYDADHIYAAFYCYDTEPHKIKRSVAKRDGLFGDDWVGMDLDAMGNRQSVVEIICNPNGIQADLLNTTSGGETLDPDWVWDSAGKVVEDGYIVEIRLPLKSFGFRSGTHVTMHVAFYRFISRTGENSSWPQIDQKKGYFNSLTPVVFEKLNKQLRLEVLPSLTYGRIQDRKSPDEWNGPGSSTQLGVGIKYGITSSVNAEITINPDFSQVESDQFQVVANQRYPLFYSEKRPFFMGVSNEFNLAGLNWEGNMAMAVHTRNIVDPGWGGKISGTAGKSSFGVLLANDEWPGRVFEDEESIHAGEKAGFYLGRYKLGLKGGSYAGFLYSGREFGEGYNRALGADLKVKLKGNSWLSMNGIYTFSKDEDDLTTIGGGSFTATFEHSQKSLGILFMAEHYGKDFQLDTGYYKRTGISRFVAYIGPQFYPRDSKKSWVKQFNPFVYGYVIRDNVTRGYDYLLFPSLRFFFSKQGSLRVDFRFINEFWAGQNFKQNELFVNGSSQFTKWLNGSVGLRYGKRLLYDKENPLTGNRLRLSVDITLQPGEQLKQDLGYTYERFNNENGEALYDLDILFSRTTFQVNKYLFFRALVQYDAYSKMVLTDLLGSFTLIPGTVIHAGFGSLHQKQYWNSIDQEWDVGNAMGKYYQHTRSFFFKASYNYRF